MGGSCHDGQYWDALIRKCMHCHLVCQHPPVITRCTSYCESANCNALPGHYYDGLLKKCVKCANVCGSHPAECSQHCQAPPPPVTPTMFLAEKHVPNSRGLSVPVALEDSPILLYSLLALCTVLLFSSLTVAVVVLLRITRPSTPGPKEVNANQKCVVQLSQEVGPPGPGSKDFVTTSSRPTDREPSDDPSPTETCVCIHCFPDLKALGQGSDRPPRDLFPLQPQAVLHRAQMQKGGPLRTEGNLNVSGPEVREEAAVG